MSKSTGTSKYVERKEVIRRLEDLSIYLSYQASSINDDHVCEGEVLLKMLEDSIGSDGTIEKFQGALLALLNHQYATMSSYQNTLKYLKIRLEDLSEKLSERGI